MQEAADRPCCNTVIWKLWGCSVTVAHAKQHQLQLAAQTGGPFTLHDSLATVHVPSRLQAWEYHNNTIGWHPRVAFFNGQRASHDHHLHGQGHHAPLGQWPWCAPHSF